MALSEYQKFVQRRSAELKAQGKTGNQLPTIVAEWRARGGSSGGGTSKGSKHPPVTAARRYQVVLDAKPVVDIDDLPLWALADGIIQGIRAFEAPQSDARQLLAEAQEGLRKYQAGESEFDAGSSDELVELGRQTGRVVILRMLAMGMGWSELRPAILDDRSIAEWIGGGISDGLDLVVPDSIDPWADTDIGAGPQGQQNGNTAGDIATGALGLLEALGIPL